MTLMSDDHRTHSNTYESKGFDLENSSLHRSDSFKYLRDVKEESDEEEEDCDELSDTDSIVSDSDSGIDSVSHFTSVSHQMTDHSLTTVTGTPVRSKSVTQRVELKFQNICCCIQFIFNPFSRILSRVVAKSAPGKHW